MELYACIELNDNNSGSLPCWSKINSTSFVSESGSVWSTYVKSNQMEMIKEEKKKGLNFFFVHLLKNDNKTK